MRRFFLPIGLVIAAIVLGVFLTVSPSTSVPTTSTALLTASSSSNLSEGQTLFAESCSSCHGTNAAGSALAPNLRGLGAATVDLWVSSGWMPLRDPTVQPTKKPAAFDREQTKDIANYVGSIAGGPAIPTVSLKGSSVASGFDIFALNCAPCHTITGAGDALADGITAPPLHGVSQLEIAEAVRTGPGNMPRFQKTQISSKELTDVISYVTKNIQHPSSPGGLGLGGVGPVAEGFIGLFVGVGLCMLLALWIGDRTEREEEEGHGHGHAGEHEVVDA